MTDYIYSKSADFPNGLAEGQLHAEIEADEDIVTTLVGVFTDGDVVTIQFVSPLSPEEETALNNVVANHVPEPTNQIISADGYIELNSSLADANALKLYASNTNGGIDIAAGFGGISIDTTNSISLDGGAASNFTTSNGNLTLEATAGLAIIEGGSGIDIGQSSTQIEIGSSASAKSITVGNTTSTSSLNLRAGTGGINIDTSSGGAISLDAVGATSNITLATNGNGQDLIIALTGANNSSIIIDSQGTGADAIRLLSTGGIDVDTNGSIDLTSSSTSSDAIRLLTGGGVDVDATGIINFASGSSNGAAITLDAAFNNGGIQISSGSQGIIISSNGGLIGIGHFSGGDIQIGTAAVARVITRGNTTGNTQVIDRWGTGGRIIHQGAPTVLADASTTLTITQVLNGLFQIATTLGATLTLPTAAQVVAAINGVQVNDAVDFVIISTGLGTATVAVGTGGTLVGAAGTAGGTSGRYRIRVTNITPSSETYTVYRV